MGTGRAALLLAFVAVAAYANSVGNGFAYDDNEIVVRNPIVVEGRVADALRRPYWPDFAPGAGLYRPVTVATFAIEWPLWRGNAHLFHAVNVGLHAAVSLALFALLAGLVPRPAAALGAGWFALHPVHTEAVANVVGRAELLASLFVLLACLLFDRLRSPGPKGRALRLIGVAACYLLALGSKEIAVTLPGLLVVLLWLRGGTRSLPRRLRDDAPLFVALAGVLGIYLALRAGAVGTVLGETPAPELQGLGVGERLRVALTLWPEYLRLMLFPFDLAADYSPAVLLVPKAWDASVLAGAMTVVALGVGALTLARRAPPATAAIVWFAVAISPVSNVFFPTGVLLGERTLYLPSVAVGFLGAGLFLALERAGGARRRSATALAAAFAVALFVRTVARNPSWLSSFTVLSTLAAEHPESTLALRSRATGLVRTGDPTGAAQAYEAALALSPNNYAALTEVGHFYGERRDWDRGEALLRRALALAPDRPHAYRLLASQYVLRERYRDAHALALQGLARSRADRELYAIVSETYIAKGDFSAALRAREAALAQQGGGAADWMRMGDILELMGDSAAAARARAEGERRSAREAA